MKKKSILSMLIIFVLVLLTLTACNNQNEEANLNSESADTSDVYDDAIEQSSQEIQIENLRSNSQDNKENLQNEPEIQIKPQVQKTKISNKQTENKNAILNKPFQQKNSIKQKAPISPPIQKACQHNFIEISRSAPTCTNAGAHTLRCNNCGTTYSEQLSPLGHILGGWDCDDVKHFRKCARCGMIESANHTLRDETCTVCGILIFTD